jgi:hypothetical protein
VSGVAAVFVSLLACAALSVALPAAASSGAPASCSVSVSACGWRQPYYDAGGSIDNTAERTITPANVGHLAKAWQFATTNGNPMYLVSGDYLVAADTYGTDVFSISTCRARRTGCAPLWSSTTGTSGGAIVGTTLYEPIATGFAAYDLTGRTNCVNRVCQPVWSWAIDPTIYSFGASPPVIDSNHAWFAATAYRPTGTYTQAVYSFDLASCTKGSCAPTRTFTVGHGAIPAPGGSYGPALAVHNGRIYVAASPGLLSIDGLGHSTTWTATNDRPGQVVVENGLVYSLDIATLNVYDAAGVQGCSTNHCNPLWSIPYGPTSFGPAFMTVSPTTLFFVPNEEVPVEAFDATGTHNCAGTPKVCKPIWKTATSATWASGGNIGWLSMAGNVLYIADFGQTLTAYDANGHTRCNTTTHICQPLFALNGRNPVYQAPIVADGNVIITTLGGGNLVYRIPGT